MRSAPGSFHPALLAEVDLDAPLRLVPCEPSRDAAGYRRAIVLVRLHTQPIGIVELDGPFRELDADALAAAIWRTLRASIAEHLREDGLAPVSRLTGRGLPTCGEPACLKERARALEDPPFISVVVPTHERPHHLERCLRRLTALAYPDYEIIVADNTPRTAATREVVEAMADGPRTIRYLREDIPGASAARNAGLRAARGELVAFADDDVIVDRHWLACICTGFRAAGDVACVTGPVLPLRFDTPAQRWMEQYADFRTGFRREVFDLGEHRSDRPLYPYNPGVFGSGGSMAFRKRALEAVGGFDTALGPATPARAGEELAAFLAVILDGHRIVFEPAALVRHHEVLEYAALRARVHAYGIGLGAYLAKSVVDRPRIAADLAVKVPYGVYLMLSSRSPKQARRTEDYPPELHGLELRGMLRGPVAYALGRARQAR